MPTPEDLRARAREITVKAPRPTRPTPGIAVKTYPFGMWLEVTSPDGRTVEHHLTKEDALVLLRTAAAIL